MSDNRVVVTDHDFDDLSIERTILDDLATVIDLSDDDDRAEGPDLEAALDGANAVLNRRTPLEADHLDSLAPDGAVVAGYGIGVDNVDLEAATRHGIPVTNVPEYCIEEVATHTLALSLALLRGLKPFDRSTAAGHWDRAQGPRIQRLSTMTVGVVGFGSIGRAVANRFRALGAGVVTSDPYVEASNVPEGIELVSFDSLVERADLLTVHSPLTASTEGMIDGDVFERLSDDGYVVNVARGPIVDTDDLLAALDDGELAGAGLDVFPREPPDRDDPLRDHRAVITTPHVAWYSEQANVDRREAAAENVRRAIVGEGLENVVNDV